MSKTLILAVMTALTLTGPALACDQRPGETFSACLDRLIEQDKADLERLRVERIGPDWRDQIHREQAERRKAEVDADMELRQAIHNLAHPDDQWR